MKKNILIYEKNPEALDFIQNYFKENKDLEPHLAKDITEFKKLVSKQPFDACIINSPEGLKQLKKSQIKSSTIAIISSNKTEGIRLAVDFDIDNFIIKPFNKFELDHKLRTAININRLLKDIFLEKNDLKNLIELIYIISSTLNPSEVLYLIVKKLSEMVNVPRCSIISIDPLSYNTATVISTSEDPMISKIKIDLRKYPEIKKAVDNKEVVIIKDAPNDPLMKDVIKHIKPLGIKSIIVIPIIFNDEVIGTLFLKTSKISRTFTKKEINLCIAFANASANIIYNAYIHEKVKKERDRLEKLAITDYLTGLYNVRYFYVRLKEEFSRTKRYNIPLCCIMIDVDHFKKINDSYGHRIGDIVLRELSQLIKRNIRKSDVLARYGGEEFILLLPNTSLDGAIVKAENIRKLIKEHSFKTLRKKELITVSAGIACSSNKKVKSEDDLITLSDTALFQAKNKGRDNVAIYS